jgi:hypothetical protein
MRHSSINMTSKLVPSWCNLQTHFKNEGMCSNGNEKSTRKLFMSGCQFARLLVHLRILDSNPEIFIKLPRVWSCLLSVINTRNVFVACHQTLIHRFLLNSVEKVPNFATTWFSSTTYREQSQWENLRKVEHYHRPLQSQYLKCNFFERRKMWDFWLSRRRVWSWQPSGIQRRVVSTK